nr:lysophospholipase-like protein 1 [Quercus suber]
MDHKDAGLSYSDPFIVEPRREHKQSLVLLHGRGSSGRKFGAELLISQSTLQLPGDVETSSSATFASMFPDARFIFPTAKKRRARWYNRATINQWFDSVPINEQDEGMSTEEEEWQLEGLKQSRAYLKILVDEEVKLVGAANVFIGGLSQGCAMGLHLLLSYEGSPSLGGFVGMSGWLPFNDAMETIVRPRSSCESRQDESEDDNPFATSGDEEIDFEAEQSHQGETCVDPPSIAEEVCNFVRDNMDLPPISPSSQPSWLSTPVFLGHGKNDEKVKMAKGLRAFNCLRDLGVQVTWNEYDEGHWYKIPEETDDIAVFLQVCLSTGGHPSLC